MESSHSQVPEDPPTHEGGGKAPAGKLPPAPGRHPIYHGIRCRSGKWVSEIREPGKMSRIWLGTFPTPEMAAAAFDVAALALKGEAALLNFRDLAASFPVPASTSRDDVRAAAMEAAARFRPPGSDGSSCSGRVSPPDSGPVSTPTPNVAEASSSQLPGDSEKASDMGEFIDEEALFYMPNLLVDMAEGMLLSPPRIGPLVPENSPENSESDTLWSYQ
ncbi:ethylene-responsive transcription factor ERF027-like [Nymphaea colorata]|uniref:AP2/ERF domain-containing protein n=1 Tax=Nymphaea colorata TaxID=210225 RepID=A0A5K1GWW7_9MAGN|nr:ethylene-responsive transcription factor ERF027-like [Nymphaea colorata]